MEKLKSILEANFSKVFVLGAGLITLPVLFEITKATTIDPEPWVTVNLLLGFVITGTGIFYCYKHLSG